MAKAKRMSEMFTSSSEKDANTTTITATPPYSSEGPTLPIIGAPEEIQIPNKKRKAPNDTAKATTNKQSQHSSHTIHPSLYKPWTRLPPDLLKLVESQTRLKISQNIVPVIFSKNQNVKSGINRLKTYLGAYKDPASTIELPEALNKEDVIIAVSAQGEGTTKLVGIVDMVRRIVAPSGKEQEGSEQVETWVMYTMLSSVEVERKAKDVEEEMKDGDTEVQSTLEEEDAFEPMDVDVQEKDSGRDKTLTKKIPVLTVWMTKKSIPAFKNAFGEQTFPVLKLLEDSD